MLLFGVRGKWEEGGNEGLRLSLVRLKLFCKATLSVLCGHHEAVGSTRDIPITNK